MLKKPGRNERCPCGSGKKQKHCCVLQTSPATLENVLKNALEHHRAGRLHEAEAAYRQAVMLQPNLPEAHYNLAVALTALGRKPEALAAYQRAITLRPVFVEAHNNLGNVLKELGRKPEALAAYQRAIAIKPDYDEAHNNLGNVLKELGRKPEALEAYQRAIKLRPAFALAHNNLGVLLIELGRFEEAETACRQALLRKPEFIETYCNLGNALTGQGRLKEAEAAYRKALELKPDFAEAYNNLGNLLRDLGQVDAAVKAYREALSLRPSLSEASSNLLFCLNYHPALSAEAIYAEYRRWDEGHADALPLPVSPPGELDPGRRLRIGYVSSDLRLHSIRHFIEPLLAHHDKADVEVFAYSGTPTEDEVSVRLKSYCDHWRRTAGMHDTALAEQISRDGIDILVDLAGHTVGNRLPVFARRAAPVQVSWLGYGYTTGLRAMDYYLADPVFAPPGCEHLFAEQLVRLPLFAVFRPGEGMGEPGPLPALRAGKVTFGTLTRSIRLNQRVVRTWAMILRAVPDSRLVLNSGNFRCESLQQSLIEQFASHGVASDCLEFGYESPPWDLLRRIDITLDCFPHNSGTTLFESLYMGIPFVTLMDRPSVGRIGAAILTGLGHQEWIAETEQKYVEKALALASDLQKLADCRRNLREEMQKSALMDEAGFAGSVEKAYRDIWGKVCMKKKLDKGGVPGTAEINHLVTLFQQCRYEEGIPLAHKLTVQFPHHGFGWKMLGALFQQKGMYQKAVTAMQQAAVLMPEDPEIYNNMGLPLRALNRVAEAEACFRQATALNPRYAEAYNNLGSILQDIFRLDEAAACFHTALELNPDIFIAHTNLAMTLKFLNRYTEALAHYQKALSINSDDAKAYQGLSVMLAHLSRYDEVVAYSNRSLALVPDDPMNWEQRLYAFSYHPDLSAEQIYAEFVRWGDRFPDPVVDFSHHDRTPGRRLKVGYVSPDFRRHTSRFFFMPLFANHDKSQIELYAYSNVKIENDYTSVFKGVFDHWRDIRGVSDVDAAELIKADGIDILVDCCNHMADDRLDVFTLKPAPIQVTWLGAAWTTGLKTVDYVLFDPYMAPAGTLARETIVRLPHFFVAYQPPTETAEIQPPPCLKNGYITFGYSGRTERLNHKTFRVWGEILQHLPTARLILDFGPFADPPTQDYYRDVLTQHGVDVSRVIMRRSLNIFEGLNDIDILLDCFPHSGGTMLFDALWMGVPALTLASRPPLGRIGTSLMMNLGLPEWVAQTEAEYIAKAVDFAGGHQALADLRAGMRDRMRNSPVMDGKGFAKGVEAAFKTMWAQWLNGEKAKTITVASGTADSLEQRVSLTPASINRLVDLFNQKHYDEGEALARELTARFPQDGFGWKILGAFLQQKGMLPEALAAMQQAAGLTPEDAELHSNMGVVLRGLNHHAEAEASYRQAIALKPDYAEAHYNLGNTLRGMGRVTEAEGAYGQAVTFKPDYGEVYNSLGVLYFEQGRLDDAYRQYRTALEVKPDYAEAHHNWATLNKLLSRNIVALQHYAAACRLKPSNALARQGLANILAYLSNYAEVVDHSNAALQLNPDLPMNWEQRLYAFSYHPDLSAEQIYAEFVRWGDRFPDPVVDFSVHDRTPGRRLKVGYVSPDFRRHTSRFFFMPLFANHDKSQIELYAYANVKVEDEFTEKFKGIFDHWRDIRGVSDVDAAELIKADGIDILVDCCNHMTDDRLDVFTLKPAPIQVTWLGAAWTTGLKTVDYVLFDPYMAPEGTLARETIVRLPHFFVAYQPPTETAGIQPPPCLKNGYITFGYSGRTERLNHKTFRVWGEILQHLPTARLILDFGPFADPPTQDYYRDVLTQHGVDVSRVIMRRSLNIFEGLNDIDILLDCFPHSGGTMLFDALWMGVPALTLASRPPLGRIGTSLMMNLGLPEWVAQTEEEYIQKAAAFAQDTQRLADLRAGMRERMQNSPVMDGKGFAQGVEAAFKAMWAQWCAQTSAVKTISIPEAIQHAVQQHQAGRTVEAEAICRQVLEADPDNFDALHLLGVLAHQTGHHAAAVKLIEQAVIRKDDEPEAYNNLGVVLKDLGRLDEALAAYQKAVALRPEYVEAYNNLGIVCFEKGLLDDAIACYKQALSIKTDYVEAYNNLGNAYYSKGWLDDAVASYGQALSIQPDYAATYNNLGNAYWLQYRYTMAFEQYVKAAQLKPEDVASRQGMARMLAYLSSYDDVVACCDAALASGPDDYHTWEQRLYAFSYHPDLSAEQIYAEFVRWGDRFPDPVVDFSHHDRTPGRRLKVGYVSPDFRRHTSRFFFMPLFANHDKSQIELYAYSNVKFEDSFTGQFKGRFDHWRNIRGMSAADAADMIKADGIDILVDCCNHMRDDRLDIFSLKPAPIQATWLGAAWTTGLKAVDYVLFDPYMAPEGTLARETIVRLPHFFVAYQQPEETAEMQPPPCLKNGYITFGYSGRTERLNHKTFRVWGEILRQLSTARLILDYAPFADPPTQEYYRQFMTQQGIDVSRVIMRRSLNIFEGLNDIDILLDCFPHSGGTMLFDALWMGVPALTLASRPPLGRIGTSLMMNLGLPEWVAQTEEEYIQKAAAFAQDTQRLADLRAGMRERMQNSPVMDGKGFAQGVEAAFKAMWAQWCAQTSAAKNISIPEAIQHAVQQHQAGRTVEAEAIYRQVLEADPDNFDALHLLGVLAHQTGQHTTAVELITKAIQVNDTEAAAFNNLGIALRAVGRTGDAVDAYQKAIALKPDYAEAYNNLANVLNELGNLKEAEKVCRQIILLHPHFAVAYYNLGVVLTELQQLEEAEAVYHQAITIKPDYAEVHYNLANVLYKLSRLAEAETAYRQAIALKANYAEAYSNLGATLQDLGRLDEAASIYRQAILVKPDYAEAYYNLSAVKKIQVGDPELTAIEKLLQQPGLREKDLVYLHYAAGKGYADTDMPERSFGHYAQGAHIKRSSFNYDVATDERLFAAIAEVFTAERLATLQGGGDPTTALVFIVGMPRSGTTLTEQILASHPEVYGAGERDDLGLLVKHVGLQKGSDFPAWCKEVLWDDLKEIGRLYCKQVIEPAPGVLRVTDKMPANFMLLGLIAVVFPNSKIIHVRRNPVDTCLSCFTQLFTGDQPYSYHLEELGRYYQAYERLMEHWRQVLPAGLMLEVLYEDLVDNLEEEARKLVAHCGLEWNPACLEFHKTDRPVQTASATQVRQPIYKSSVEKWRTYEPWLGELLEVLQG